MRETRGRRLPISVTLVSLLAFPPATGRADRPATPEADLDAFHRDPQCGSKAAMGALGEYFRLQGEMIVGAGRTAGRVAEAAGKAAPAAAEAANARTELAAIAADVARAGPDAAKQAAALVAAIGDLEKDAGAAAALDGAAVTAEGAALETSVGPFVAECAGCASAMAAAATEPWGAGAAPASGPCGRALEDAAKIGETFTRIRRFVGATVVLSRSIRGSVQDITAAADALTQLGQELGSNAKPGLDRIEASLNRSIDAVSSAGQTYDAQVAPSVAKLAPSLLQQLADNTDRLMACYGKLQDVAGRKTKRLAPIRFNGSLEVPGGLTLARPIAKIHLGALPPTKVR